MVKKELWNSHRILSISPNERLMFICMFNVADDDGILKNSALQMKSICYSCDSDITLGMVQEYINNIISVGLIELNDERTLIRICKWKDHQRIDKPTPSKYIFKRSFQDTSKNGIIALKEDSNSTLDERKGKKDKERQKKEKEVVQDKTLELFNSFYSLYPRKQDKKRAYTAFNNLTKANQKLCIEGVTIYVQWLKVNNIVDKTLIKLPTTYINGEHWNDELDTTVIKQPDKVEFKLDATGNSVIAYCSKCSISDFYDPFKVHTMDSKCCNGMLLNTKPNVDMQPEPEVTTNTFVKLSDIMDKYQ